MNKKKHCPPQYIMDLIIGYSKQNSNSLIPICINKLFVAYFFIFKHQELFCIKCRYPEPYCTVTSSGVYVWKEETDYFFAISSISSNIVLSNECYKLIFKIGNNFVVEINILESKINVNAQGQVMELQNIDGDTWQINRKSTKNFDIMFRINRKTICSCEDTDGSLEFFFNNIEKIPQIALTENSWWNLMDFNDMQYSSLSARLNGKIETNQNHGYCKISLNNDFDYYSNEQISIEAHGTDKMNIWSSKHAEKQVDEHGFGRECCIDACRQFAKLEED